jgi:hypothetical protein
LDRKNERYYGKPRSEKTDPGVILVSFFQIKEEPYYLMKQPPMKNAMNQRDAKEKPPLLVSAHLSPTKILACHITTTHILVIDHAVRPSRVTSPPSGVSLVFKLQICYE